MSLALKLNTSHSIKHKLIDSWDFSPQKTQPFNTSPTYMYIWLFSQYNATIWQILHFEIVAFTLSIGLRAWEAVGWGGLQPPSFGNQ